MTSKAEAKRKRRGRPPSGTDEPITMVFKSKDGLSEMTFVDSDDQPLQSMGAFPHHKWVDLPPETEDPWERT
jgi:hypothetical protein